MMISQTPVQFSGQFRLQGEEKELQTAATRLRKMAKKHHSSAIVMQNNKLVGIFTTVDACYALNHIIEQNIEEANMKYVNYIRHSADRRAV